MEMIYHATTDIQPIVTSPLKRDASVVVEEEIGSRQSHNIHVTDRAKNKAQREPVLIKNRDFSKGLITKRKYPDNTVRTTIYTWWNFVVLNILIQYCTKFSNIYFTVVMIFSVLPGVSPVFPVTSIIPICFIVGVNMLKDGFEDFMRWQADRKVNIKPCILVDETGTEKKITTSAVYAGDIIKVRDGETFPADLVLLSSASKNMCYIETANLDGESNYKQRRALAETAKFVTPESCTKLIGSRITCGPPDNRLYEFEGTFHMPASLKNDLVLNHGVETTDIQEIETTEDFKFPLGKDNILLKGSSLRNTEWVYGVTVYTGHDTKLMKNMKKRKTKRGYVETRLNYLLSGLLLVHQIVCIINVVLYVVYQGITGFNSFYLLPISTRSIDAAFVIYGYCTNFVLFSLMIPMSLFVSLQFVKAIQGGFMTQDKLMEFEGKRMLANATDLNADLSQIEIIFSDKTGTLTNNEMFFRKAAVGKDFLFVKTEHNPDGLAREIIEAVDREKLNENERERATYILHYLLCMSLCHLASPKSKHADEDEEVIEPDSPVKPIEKEQIEYQAESPDEIALVLACRDNLFVVNDCTDRFIDLEVFGREHRFFIEAVIEFTPDRKRMSSVLRVPSSFVKQFPWFVKEGTVIGYSKGADSYMFKLLNEGRTEEEQTAFKEQKKFIEKYANEYADEGLRTLVMCVKILEPETATKWITDWKNASVATENRSKRLEEVAATLECELDMIGCSAIEDLLQDYVPETIRFIVAAGIKMWMLTGDKRQTAKNIARTTGLFSEHTVVFDLDGSDRSVLNEATIMDTMTKMYDGIITTLETTDDVALIVDGDALNLALHKSCVPVFVKIIGKVRTAICCRATPLHKATLVELMGKKYKMTGLAIGDGANDVPMILKAKVGVGIAGKEGSQAKQASDYCLQRFFHLKRLLFVHGRYSLTRSALFVQYSFYKNLTLTFIQVFFQYYCLYSGQTTVDSWILNLYNLIFTVLPPFVMGLIDKDVNEQVLLENPRLYKQMHKQSILNHWTFGAWILQALYHSVAVFFFTWYVCFYNGLYAYKNDSLWITATMLASVSFVVVNLKALLEYCSFTWIHVACQLISFLSFYIFLFCYSGVPILQGSANMYYIMYNEVMSGNFWLLHLLIIPVCMIPDVSIKLIKKYFFPYESERLQRQYVGLNRKKRNEAKAIALETELEEKSVVNI